MKKLILDECLVIVDLTNDIPRHRDSEYRIRVAKRMADDVIKQINRHVDHGGGVYKELKYEQVCEHCGNRWESDNPYTNASPDDLFTCCDKDLAPIEFLLGMFSLIGIRTSGKD